MGNNSTSSGPRIPFVAMRQVSGFHEPMRTRAIFYLEQLAKNKQQGEDLTPADINASIGRAFRDKCDDQAVVIDREALAISLKDAETGNRFRPLREIVDALYGGNSRDGACGN